MLWSLYTIPLGSFLLFFLLFIGNTHWIYIGSGGIEAAVALALGLGFCKTPMELILDKR
jgi:hypothetical protein